MSQNNQVPILLVKRRANVNARDKDGDTPLLNAVTLGNDQLVALLRRRGADPWPPDPKGGNVMRSAREDSDPTMVRTIEAALMRLNGTGVAPR